MHWDKLCSAVGLFLLFFAQVCQFQKHPACRHDRYDQSHPKAHSTRRFCDPSLSNQTAGSVTKKCGAGFHRARSGPHRGQCVACSCNKLSDECDEQTGNCVNCQFNTTGDHCERCKDGYYGNAAQRTCRACPCPFTWNSFAVACLDVGSEVVECLCLQGYTGARCERCAHGYYGNTAVKGGSCKPCSCKDDTGNACDSLTGECITAAGNSSKECGGCSTALLAGAEELDDGLALLKQQLRNVSQGSGSLSRLNELNANTSGMKIVVGGFGTAVKHLDAKVEQLETDTDVVRYDVNQLTDETYQIVSHVENLSHSAKGTKLKARDVLSEAESLYAAGQDLIQQLSAVKPEDSIALSENVRTMEEAQGCTAQRDAAGSEHEEAHQLLHSIRINISSEEPGRAVLNHGAESLMVLDSSLNKVAELLSDAEETVNRAKGLNPQSSSLHHLQHLQTQLEGEQSGLLPVMEMTQGLLRNITDTFSSLQEMTKECETRAAQLDGAKWELVKLLNKLFHVAATMDAVTKAGEHAEQLSRAADGFQHVFPNGTSTTDLLRVLGIGAYNNFINDIEKLKMAADEMRLAAEKASKEVEEGGLITRAEGLRDNSTRSNAEASETRRVLKRLSRAVDTHKKHTRKQKKERKLLRAGLSAVTDDLKRITTDDIKVVLEAAATAASTSNSTVDSITERLKVISQEARRITSPGASVYKDALFMDAQQMLRSLKAALPVLKDNLTHVAALSRMPPTANVTESIWKIKDVIEETRNFVNRLPAATSFNGRNHVELRLPKTVEDLKAFTAVDLLLNRHQTEPPRTERGRTRRQAERTNQFVFYLGNKDTSGDYAGMAIRHDVLTCVYKLGGVVHELQTGPVTATAGETSSHFDRVVFHRVYQDAEVHVTLNSTSLKPVRLPANRSLPDAMGGVLDLHPDRAVFYVGGYPEDFTPPAELRYPRYRGAMKLSYVNDRPACLFNYKRAANMDAKQPFIRTPQSEVSDYYDGTGYRMALVKEANEKKRRLFKFHTNSRETNALLFYIGNEESFFLVFVEKGFLVLQGQQAGQELRAQSDENVSLFDQLFAVRITNKFTVQCGAQRIFTDHVPTGYVRYFIGGLPAELRRRHNVTVPPLRGCVDHLTADGESVEYSRTVGVTGGCPLSLLGVRAATLRSGLSADSLFVWDQMPLRVSLGFRTTDRSGVLVRSSSQGSASVRGLQLSLADGYLVLNSDNYTLKSDERYSDGSWHYLCAARRPTGLELSVDNVKVEQRRSRRSTAVDDKALGENFTACVANLYSRRPEQSFLPADLGSLSRRGDAVLGSCRAELLAAPVLNPPQTHKPAPADGQCGGRRADESHLYEDHSWIRYVLPLEDLNHRPHFSFDFKTKSFKGLIFHVAGKGPIRLLAVYIANGKIKMSLGLNRVIQHNRKSNDGNWHRVEFSVERSTFHLLVDGFRVTDGQLSGDEGSALDLDNSVYLGGDRSTALKKHSVPVNSVIGCIRNFRMNHVPVGEPEASHRTLPCVEWHEGMGTYFGGGHIVLDNHFSVGSDFVLAFELRPRHLTGLLFHFQSNKTSLDVFLMENRVGVKVSDGDGAVSLSVTPHQSLCDERFHMVKVSKQGEVITLEVDSVDSVAGLSTSVPSSLWDSLYVGGTTKYSRAPVSSPFVGCLRNVEINHRPVAFESESRVVQPVSINTCPVY